MSAANVTSARSVIDPDSYSQALLNILGDVEDEKLRMRQAHRAVLNILDDASEERMRLKETQRAVLNILDDASLEQSRVADTQRAVLNILEDSVTEKTELHATQRAVLNILEDVEAERSERARAEGEVRALNNELEERVIQRTAALSAMNRELESFSYSVSHDLRAPLRTIDGFSQVLLEDYFSKLDDEGRDALQRVRDATQRMGRLIDDMLMLSRVIRVELDIGPVDVTGLADEVMAWLRAANPSRDVDVSIARGICCIGDATLLRAVFENLFSNALKFTGKRADARIDFSAERIGDEVVCHVRDNGAGFDMAYADNLFSPFHRLHRPSDFPGNGVGLATVKRIISRLGGRVWAEGIVDQGATFHFTLRAAQTLKEQEHD